MIPSLLDQNPKLKSIVEDLVNKRDPRPEDVADVVVQGLEAAAVLCLNVSRIADALEKLAACADGIEPSAFRVVGQP